MREKLRCGFEMFTCSSSEVALKPGVRTALMVVQRREAASVQMKGRLFGEDGRSCEIESHFSFKSEYLFLES